MTEVSEGRGAKRTPWWKLVFCPACGSKAGESCGTEVFGAPGRWQRTAPHAARKKLAAQIAESSK